jgi:hypothetical protein
LLLGRVSLAFDFEYTETPVERTVETWLRERGLALSPPHPQDPLGINTVCRQAEHPLYPLTYLRGAPGYLGPPAFWRHQWLLRRARPAREEVSISSHIGDVHIVDHHLNFEHGRLASLWPWTDVGAIAAAYYGASLPADAQAVLAEPRDRFHPKQAQRLVAALERNGFSATVENFVRMYLDDGERVIRDAPPLHHRLLRAVYEQEARKHSYRPERDPVLPSRAIH